MFKEHEPKGSVVSAESVTKAHYDRLSRWYNLLAARSERKALARGLELLDAGEGETVLEVGYGTGHALVALARAVGEGGHVLGIDISEGMRRVATGRLMKAALSDRVELRRGDAAGLPFDDDSVDAVFMSFTLDLFDAAEIPIVLGECRRVLRVGGRIVVVSMLAKRDPSRMARLYEWVHQKLPRLVDCRSIDAAGSLEDAGFVVGERIEQAIWRLPVSILAAEIPAVGQPLIWTEQDVDGQKDGA